MTLRLLPLTILLNAALASPLYSQSSQPPATPQDINAFSEKLDALARNLEETRSELSSAREEIRQLHEELNRMRDAGPNSTTAAESLKDAVQSLEEKQEVLSSEVAQQEQSKVETVSKYPVRITGLLLFNALRTEGGVNNPYAPTFAVPAYQSLARGSLQGLVQQSILGIDARGPSIAGSSTSADVRTDFFGGQANYGLNNSSNTTPYIQSLRLRTLHIKLDWPETQLSFFYDRPVFSPNAPASISAVGIPPLAWSGNLWVWQPQLSVTHKLDLATNQQLELTAGLMDVPDPPAFASGLSAGERSRYPGSEARIGYLNSTNTYGGSSFGIGGYWSPHNYGEYGSVEAWAVTADYRIGLPAHFAITGQIYRGAALGGIGGGTYKDVVSLGIGADSLEALRDAGGWTQLKYAPSQRVEFNGAFGTDDSDAYQLRLASYLGDSAYAALARNQSEFGNVIYRPSAYLLFSAEYRHLRSWPLSGAAATADIYSLSTGYQF